MRRSSFAHAASSEGADALNRVFERYLVPIDFSAEQLQLHVAYNDVDPAASPIWYDDAGGVLAAALLAFRGDRAWIGGFGVAPEYRGHGYATQLLESLEQAARERGARTVQLEVLAGNHAAIALYRNAGFEPLRTLHTFERLVERAEAAEGFIAASPGAFIDAPDPVLPCWQREPQSLRNGAASAAITDGKGTYAVYRSNPHLAQIFKLHAQDARRLDAIAEAISGTRDSARVAILNEPEESGVCAHAKTARWSEPFMQYEMKLRLD